MTDRQLAQSSVQDRLRRERDELDLLLEIGRILDRYPNVAQAGPALAEQLESRLGLTRAWVAVRDEPGGPLREPESGAEIRLGQGPAGRAFESGAVVAEAAPGGWAYLVPALEGERVLALVHALRPGADRDSAEDRAVLSRVAELVADAAALRLRLAKAGGTDGEGAAGSRPIRPADALPRSPFGMLVGSSDAMRSLYAYIERIAPSEATVLILGESGTGKELAAAELHRGSRRSAGPFVKVNCAALPESIIESELFGHEKGSFTGALARRRGRFEAADGGTIFLDEIGELSPAVQAKLLRAIQEREIERVGGHEPIPVDVRIVAATNRDIEREVAEGRFRDDLYYRLNVFALRMPPLRQRKSDILLLADWFVEKYAERNGKDIRRISSPAIDLLASYHWPGNVRELENCVERAVILSSDKVIHAWHLPPSLQSAESTATAPASTLEAALARLERELIVEALKLHKGNMAAASRQLGITERQIGLRVKHYGLDWRSYRLTQDRS